MIYNLEEDLLQLSKVILNVSQITISDLVDCNVETFNLELGDGISRRLRRAIFDALKKQKKIELRRLRRLARYRLQRMAAK